MWMPARFLQWILLVVGAASQDCNASEVSLLQRAPPGEFKFWGFARSSPDQPSSSSVPASESDLQARADAAVQKSIAKHMCQRDPSCATEHDDNEPTPTSSPPEALPPIDFSNGQKTQAAWQTPVQKAFDNGISSPALGWNSWNQFNLDVNESKVLAVAQAMKADKLLDSGFVYIIIDDGWASPNRDAAGRMQADPGKFPKGIKWLADQLHSHGFKFGIYTSVGAKTCGGDQPGIMGHHEVDAETFASWDVDYVKVDRCGWPGELSFAPGLDPDDLPEGIRVVLDVDFPVNGQYLESFYKVTGRVEAYQNFSGALNKTGRLMYLEICDWGEDSTLQFAPKISNSFRMLWDNFPQWHRVAEIYAYFAQVTDVPASTRPGAYAFPDMLEGGVDGYLYNRDIFPKSSLTEREAATEHAMWSMWSSPLILGYDVANPEKSWVTDIVKNPAMLKIQQDPLGIAARLAIRKQKTDCLFSFCSLTDVWVKPLTGGEVAVALVNMAGTFTENNPYYRTETISVTWKTLGLSPDTPAEVYSATEQRKLGTSTGSVSEDVEPHGAKVLVIRPMIASQ